MESKRSMHRKQKVYAEMADKQLEDIMATMMSVSSVSEPAEMIEEAEEQSSFAFSERFTSFMTRKNSEVKVNEKFALEV